jgi:nitrogen fixation protein
MADKGKKQTVGIDETRLPKLLEEKIRDDYAGGRIVIIKGWVLSITEARQSALYSLGLQ